MDQSNDTQVGAGQDADYIPNLQGNISLTATGGSHSTTQIGQSPVGVDWVQGSTPVASAQLSLGQRMRPPITPPMVTDLNVGENSIPIFGNSTSAWVSWTYGAGGEGAATFNWGMGGLPVGSSGTTYVSEATSAQQGSFQIAFADTPTSCLLSFQINPSQAFMGPQLVLVYVDGNYVGALADGTSIVITGKVLTLSVDIRAESYTEVQVGYTLQYQW